MYISTRHNFLIALSLLCLLLFMNGCTPSDTKVVPKIADGGLLSEQPCGPPCMWNITPGKTSKQEAIDVLIQKGIYNDCQFFDNSSESGGRGIVCSPYIIVILNENEDIVSGIGFRPSQKITVEEIVSKYGDPSSVQVSMQGIPEGELHATMMLFYDEMRINIVLPEQDFGPYVINGDLPVENVGYSDQASYKPFRQYSQIWHGYGDYELINP